MTPSAPPIARQALSEAPVAMGVDARSAKPAAAPADERLTARPGSYTWLLPWVLASIGFLLTLALLR
jgi:hypothetical protein